MYIYVCTHAGVYVCVMYVCILYSLTQTCMYVRVDECKYTRMFVSIYVFIYSMMSRVYIDIHMYVHTYTNIHVCKYVFLCECVKKKGTCEWTYQQMQVCMCAHLSKCK